MLHISSLSKHNIFYAIFALFCLGNILFFIAGNYFYQVIMNYNITDRRTDEEYDRERGVLGVDMEKIEALKHEDVIIPSSFGYNLQGRMIKNSQPTENTVILVHGIGKDKNWSEMKYASLFLSKGFNVFVYDSRGHGESGGEHPSYGFYEKEDLECVAAYIRQKNQGQGIIGIHGESMGAATALLHAEKYGNNIAFYVSDCAYSDLYQLYYIRCADYSVPVAVRPLLLNYLSLVCKIRSGFYLTDISPIKDIGKISVPVLFIQGTTDDFVPTFMSNDLFAQKDQGMRELYQAVGAKHAQSIDVNQAAYDEVVQHFLARVEKQLR